jgi:hypothetical protein
MRISIVHGIPLILLKYTVDDSIHQGSIPWSGATTREEDNVARDGNCGNQIVLCLRRSGLTVFLTLGFVASLFAAQRRRQPRP